MFGLSDRHIGMIREKMAMFDDIEEALIFGSRAMGNYKKGSDIDIALKGDSVTANTTSKLKFELSEKTNLPYFFDVVALSRIHNDDLLEHINTYGMKIYESNVLNEE
jgi:predicted nucleotidyltransferase